MMKNGKPHDLEARLVRLEADMQEIKALLKAKEKSKEPWWESWIGIYENDPVAAEVLKDIEETRERERRKARRQPKRKLRTNEGRG